MSAPEDRTKDIRDIQPERLIKYRISDDHFSAEVLLPGLWYTDFDKKIGGRVTFQALAKTFESSRLLALPKGFIYFDKLRDKTNTAFLVSSKYSVSPEFNSIRGKTSWGVNLPLLFKFAVTQIGNSSFTFETQMTDHTTGKPLASLLSKFVFVDFKTRRPKLLPDWFLAQKAKISDERTIEKPEKLHIPDGAYKFETTASHSDTDQNLHVNQSVYIKWCTDAGTNAAKTGCYRDFTDNIQIYPLSCIKVQYVGESMVGDALVVYTWQDEEMQRTLRFVITRNGKPIVTTRFSYHDNRVQSNQARL